MSFQSKIKRYFEGGKYNISPACRRKRVHDPEERLTGLPSRVAGANTRALRIPRSTSVVHCIKGADIATAQRRGWPLLGRSLPLKRVRLHHWKWTQKRLLRFKGLTGAYCIAGNWLRKSKRQTGFWAARSDQKNVTLYVYKMRCLRSSNKDTESIEKIDRTFNAICVFNWDKIRGNA